MKQKINKFINFRFALCVALMVITSVILSSYVFVSQKMKLALILIIASVFLFVVISFAFFKKRFLLVISAIVLVGIFPAISIYFKAESLNKNNLLLSEKTTFSGKICEFNENLDENAIFINLSDVKILSNNTRKDFNGMIYVRVVADGVDTSKLDIGRFVTIYNAEIEGLTLNEGVDKRSRSFISDGVSATSFILSHNLKFEDKSSRTIRDKIKSSVYENFEETDTFFTDIGFAMLFGESEILNDDVYDSFKFSGVAHLLAVSGFHVSIVVSFLVFILNKIKTNKYLKFSIVAGLMLFYAYLCSFSASVMRASLMAILLLYANNRNKEYDRLTALSLSLIAILLVSPMKMFSLSFILSFVSSLSIILLMPIFERFFSKFLTEKLSSSIAITLAVSFGILVFQLYYFGYYPVLSIVSNLITIPIVSALFIFLIISVVIGPIFCIATPLIEVFGFCMKYVVQFNAFIAKNGLYLTCDYFGSFAMILSVLLMLLISDYVFLKKRIKLPIAGLMLLALVLVII